jgi:prepilin-type N-terminal cleavage/methylation domain-containing protein
MNIALSSRKAAFTLIELLVVVTIIGIVAAMALNMNKAASKAKKDTMVSAEKNKLMTMIESYQSKLNFYPPDNGELTNTSLTQKQYDGYAATNPLLYELTGVTNVNSSGNTGFKVIVFDGSVQPITVFAVYNRLNGGIANSDATEPNDFFLPGPKPTDYAPYTISGGTNYGLVVPADLVPNNSTTPNFWHYDASSPQRHNPNSFDLWAEYEVGNKNGALVIITNGNW